MVAFLARILPIPSLPMFEKSHLAGWTILLNSGAFGGVESSSSFGAWSCFYIPQIDQGLGLMSQLLGIGFRQNSLFFLLELLSPIYSYLGDVGWCEFHNGTSIPSPNIWWSNMNRIVLTDAGSAAGSTTVVAPPPITRPRQRWNFRCLAVNFPIWFGPQVFFINLKFQSWVWEFRIQSPQLVGRLEHQFFIFPEILGISSSQLTNSNLFQRGGPCPPTRWNPIEIDD